MGLINNNEMEIEEKEKFLKLGNNILKIELINKNDS